MNSPERQHQIGIAIEALIREKLLEEDSTGDKIGPTVAGFVRVAEEICLRWQRDVKTKYEVVDEEEGLKLFSDYLTDGGTVFGITNFLVSMALGDLDA